MSLLFDTSAPADGNAPAPDHPVWKKILLSALMVGMFFGLLELVLLAAGVEPVLVEDDPFVGFAGNVPLFVETTAPSGAKFLETAPNKRLFNPQRFPARKGPNTYRIFCLGGSTTYGRPFDDNSSFSGWLRELLPLAAPGTDWEVINVGAVSYASYRVAHLMEELVRYEPDLFIVYSGQNEFLEERTYRTLKSTPAFVRAVSGLLARTRTWALMNSLLDGLGITSPGSPADKAELAEEADTLLEHFGPEAYQRDDKLAAQIREHFVISLDRMARLAAGSDAAMVLVKPAVNIKDCSPFKSQPTDGLSAEDLTRSAAAAASAADALAAGQLEPALAHLDRALALDPRNADHHYRRGRVLLLLGRQEEARTAFYRALEEDVCPLRIQPVMMNGIETVAQDRNLPVVDFERLIADKAREELGSAIAGEEFFLDHVHPTIRANGLLALELAQTVLSTAGLPAARLTPDQLRTAGENIEQRLDPAKRARSLANLAAVLAWSGKTEDAVRPARQALEFPHEDPLTVKTAANILATWYATTGDLEQEKRYFRLALNANPGMPDTHWRIGLRALDRQPPEVELACAHLLFAAVYWQGEQRDAPHRILGGILASRGHGPAAYSHLLEARAIDPGHPETKELLARVGGQLGGAAASFETPKFTVEKHPSGAISTIVQVRLDSRGQPVSDGIWTEWHPGGEPSLYREMSGGRPRGVEVRWDPEGREVSRAVR